MINFEPQKGKAYDKLPNKTLDKFDNEIYVTSTKYDGNQIFIAKQGDKTRFFTSDWKEFNLSNIDLSDNEEDFTVVGEFMFDCEGKLGDRTKSAKLTTYRTNFNKGLANDPSDEAKTNIKLFDYVDTSLGFAQRVEKLRALKLVKCLEVVDHILMTGKQAKERSKALANLGWEGLMLVENNSMYQIGKRVNHAIKLKHRKTVDLLCIDIIGGTGKYHGQIGSIVLQDSEGRIVAVGSGLSDSLRSKPYDYFIGKIVEIEYEQILDTYIQPTFITIREDKKISD